MKTIKKKVSFGLKLDDYLTAKAKQVKGFVEFVGDGEYFIIEKEVPTDKDFVYFKRNNGEKVVV